MKKISGVYELQLPLPGAVVTIGNFDGVHLGHSEILERLVQMARSTSGTSVVYSFKPHPRTVLRPGEPLNFLSTYSERKEHIEKSGVDVFIEEPFSRTFSNIDPTEFFKTYLIERIGTKVLMVGYDFAFGKNRKGDLDLLKKICSSKSVALEVIEAQKKTNQIISSTEIRKALAEAKIKRANEMLGYAFYYRGNVVRGDQRGRTIGFPTANLKAGMKITLPYGVYATKTTVDRQNFYSITNVGIRPTFGESQVVIETHLIGQEIDLYGVEIKVEFLDFIREEKKFPSLDVLKKQIETDIAAVKSLLP